MDLAGLLPQLAEWIHPASKGLIHTLAKPSLAKGAPARQTAVMA